MVSHKVGEGVAHRSWVKGRKFEGKLKYYGSTMPCCIKLLQQLAAQAIFLIQNWQVLTFSRCACADKPLHFEEASSQPKTDGVTASNTAPLLSQSLLTLLWFIRLLHPQLWIVLLRNLRMT